MLADQLAEAIALAPTTTTLDDLARVLWRGVAEGAIPDDAALRLGEAVQARRRVVGYQTPGNIKRRCTVPSRPQKRHPQKTPCRQRSLERRRRLAASGPMPPSLACKFTVGQLAALRIVADEVRRRGACRLPLDAIAARAGVSRRTAQLAIREAERLGLVLVRESRRTAWMSHPNTITVVSREWSAWIRFSRVKKPARHGNRDENKSPNVHLDTSGGRDLAWDEGRGGGGNRVPSVPSGMKTMM